MRRGQAENWFSDLIPGVLILLLAYAIYFAGNVSVTSSPVIDSTIQDAFERELLTLLQSPAPERPSITYGDWLALLFLNPVKRPVEEPAFIAAFSKQLNALPLVSFYQQSPKRQQHSFVFDVRFQSSSGDSVLLDNFARSFPLPQKPDYRTAFFFPHVKEALRVEVTWGRITMTNVQEVPPGYA